MLFLLLACKGDPTDSDSNSAGDPWCTALQGEAYGSFDALPAGNNGPEIYEPWIHQSINLTPQGGDLYTGSVRYTPPQAGTYVLAFGNDVDVLFRGGTEDQEGTEMEPACEDVLQLSFELEETGYHLQFGSVPEMTLSVVSSDAQ